MSTRRISIVAALFLVLVGAGFYVVARPYLLKHPGNGVRMPGHRPSSARWVWPDGVPGWKPGETYRGIEVANVQPVEALAAQLAAAHRILDPDQVRVLAVFRPGDRGAYAILAAPTREVTPQRTCLAALRLDAPVVWECPGPHHLSRKHIYAVVVRTRESTILVGVARGDVDRVEFGGTQLVDPKTWGEFSGGWTNNPHTKQILVYGHGRLLERIPVDLQPGQSEIVR